MPLSKLQLGSLLWGIADTGLRGKVEDYKAYILSLLFFKRLSDNYEWETEKRVGQFREQYGKEATRPVRYAFGPTELFLDRDKPKAGYAEKS